MPTSRSQAADRERTGGTRLGLEFQVEFFEAALRHRPGDVEVLAELAHAYTRSGRIHEGLEVDRDLVRRAPENPTVHYNLACSLALCGEAQAALDALEAAVALGYSDGEHLARDDDLERLRSEPRFAALLARLER